MVTLGVVTVAEMGVGLWGVWTERVSVSSRTRTKLLIVSRIFSTGGMLTSGPSFEARPDIEMGEAAIDSGMGEE